MKKEKMYLLNQTLKTLKQMRELDLQDIQMYDEAAAKGIIVYPDDVDVPGVQGIYKKMELLSNTLHDLYSDLYDYINNQNN